MTQREAPEADMLPGLRAAVDDARAKAAATRRRKAAAWEPAATDPVARVLDGDRPAGLPGRTLLVRRDGAEVPIADSAAPVCNAEGRLMGVVLVFRDITARRDSERRARQWTADLERRVAERTA